jgi:flagella basal body P-ring formation protein FlgA
MGAKIRSLMRQANLGEGVSVLIPEQVVVARASQRLSAQDLTRLYIEAVTERLGPKASEADISRVEAGNDLILPAGRLDTNLRFLSSSLIGRVPALIEVMVDGRREALARVVGTVDIYAQVAVAARPLMQRHVLGPEDVAMARISLNEAGPGAIFEAQEAIGMRARAMVPLGAPLDLTRLEKTPLVRLGEVVVMVYNDGGLRITAKGRAEQTGYLGGRIRLTNLASRREVYGKVLEAGRVLVD